MRKKSIIVANLACMLFGAVAIAPAEASRATQWWMQDWSCKNDHDQKIKIGYATIIDTDCDGDACTNNGGGIAVLTKRFVGGEGVIKFQITSATEKIVIATDRPSGGDSELKFITQFFDGRHDRAYGETRLDGHVSSMSCTTGSFASLDPIIVRKPGAKFDGKKVKPPKSGTIARKAASDPAILKKATPKLEIPDIAE